MYTFTYETKNKINGKIYVGVHSTSDLTDGYLGSGKLFNRALAKYGEESFQCTVLKFFNTVEEAFAHEKEIVNESFLKRDDVYNIKLGGHGGWDHVNSDLDKIAEMGKNRLGNKNGMFGKKHSNETKEQISKNKTGHKLGKQSVEHIKKKSLARSSLYAVTSPEGIEHTTYYLPGFCEEHGLPYKTMSKIPKKKIQPTRGKCVGWIITKLND